MLTSNSVKEDSMVAKASKSIKVALKVLKEAME